MQHFSVFAIADCRPFREYSTWPPKCLGCVWKWLRSTLTRKWWALLRDCRGPPADSISVDTRGVGLRWLLIICQSLKISRRIPFLGFIVMTADGVGRLFYVWDPPPISENVWACDWSILLRGPWIFCLIVESRTLSCGGGATKPWDGGNTFSRRRKIESKFTYLLPIIHWSSIFFDWNTFGESSPPSKG